ncbi:MAG: site-2 protease family protein [Bacteroidia bacterium]|nr:site-2 protease family protein [Bacteroidia bacterium]
MKKPLKQQLLHAGLFLATFITTTLAGSELAYSRSIFMYSDETGWLYTWSDFLMGLNFSVPFMLFLTVHEFGHYFMAKRHNVRTSLPYYIPVPPGLILSIGTLGAVIRFRSKVYSTVQHFDIGLAGPLAGFIIALCALIYGFATLPPPEYIYSIHPEYEEYGLSYADHVYNDDYRRAKAKELTGNEENLFPDIAFGNSILYNVVAKLVADPQRVPNPHELMHYPLLMAAFFGLLFTGLNLLPIGQLDGGHIIYGLFGRKGHSIIAITFLVALIYYSGLGLVDLHDPSQGNQWLWSIPAIGVYNYLALSSIGRSLRDTVMYALLILATQLLAVWFFPGIHGYSGWMIFGLLVGRFLGVHHPAAELELPLNGNRQVLGWLALIIFVICFSPSPLQIT